MTEEFNDIKHLIGTLNPISEDQFAGAAQDAEGRAALYRIVGQTLEPASSIRPHLWTRRRFMMVSAGAMAVIATVTIRELPTRGQIATPPPLHYRLSGASMSTTPSASVALAALASIADRQPDAKRPADAAFSHITTNEWNLSAAVADDTTTSAIVPMVVEQWTPLTAVGTYRRIERRGTPKIFQVGSEATAAAVTEVLPLSDERLPINAGIGPHADILASESVEQLRAELLRGHADPREPVTYRLIRAVRVLHSHHVVPARLAGGLWRMLAQQPDLTFAGEVTDRAGRSGQAIAFDFDLSLPKRWMLVISPETGRLLAFEEILTTDAGKLNIQIPAVIGYEVFLTQEWAVAER